MSICSEHNKVNCGCQQALTSAPPCPTPEDCPEAQPCSAVFDSECIRYTGDPLTCSTVIIVDTDDNLETALTNIIDYFCENSGITVVEAGDGIDVTSSTVGSTTTYTVSTEAPLLRKFVKEFLSVLDGDTVTITAAELQACGLITDSCGNNGTEPSDFTYAIYYLAETEWVSISQVDAVVVKINAITGNISIVLGTSPVDETRVRVVIIG
jgi:hypothetical protein